MQENSLMHYGIALLLLFLVAVIPLYQYVHEKYEVQIANEIM